MMNYNYNKRLLRWLILWDHCVPWDHWVLRSKIQLGTPGSYALGT